MGVVGPMLTLDQRSQDTRPQAVVQARGSDNSGVIDLARPEVFEPVTRGPEDSVSMVRSVFMSRLGKEATRARGGMEQRQARRGDASHDMER